MAKKQPKTIEVKSCTPADETEFEGMLRKKAWHLYTQAMSDIQKRMGYRVSPSSREVEGFDFSILVQHWELAVDQARISHSHHLPALTEPLASIFKDPERLLW